MSWWSIFSSLNSAVGWLNGVVPILVPAFCLRQLSVLFRQSDNLKKSYALDADITFVGPCRQFGKFAALYRHDVTAHFVTNCAIEYKYSTW
jgi:hypothetical protein